MIRESEVDRLQYSRTGVKLTFTLFPESSFFGSKELWINIVNIATVVENTVNETIKTVEIGF